jgi:NAD(P)H-dependent FMN reductase
MIMGFSTGVTGRESNIDRMVKAILDQSGHDSEFVKLTDLTYSGCKGCVNLCVKDKVCKLEDDLFPYYEKIKEADAVVVGSPIYFDSINASTMTFLERFFGYRHMTSAIRGKPFVLLTASGGLYDSKMYQFTKRLALFEVEVIDLVHFTSSVVPCFRCGYHKKCRIGGLYEMVGEEALKMKITPEMFINWEDNPETVAAVDAAAEKLKVLS